MAEGRFTISCDTCSHEGSAICADCVVSFLLGRDPGDAIIIDAAEARTVRLFERVGLLPALRHEERAG
ncbi:MAG TPA: hypothetical protein VED84_06665 [Acidimicrobiales bacterium]|nr:hypothetical protein [Acidimicrobiales bacterium]